MDNKIKQLEKQIDNLQNRVSIDYQNTNTFVKNIEKSVTNIGIYENHADFAAADAYASGFNTSVTLPNVLGMNLSHGGHLTHGHPINFSGIDYEIVSYDVNKDTEMIDYEELKKLNYNGYIRNFTNNDELILIKEEFLMNIIFKYIIFM